jgi:tRNA (guanine37-N1)-methyltransferase
MRFDLLTVHPEMCRGPIEHSMLARARAAGVIAVEIHDIRVHGTGKHRQVDDTPYGGGSGMVLKVDVVDRAIAAVRGPEASRAARSGRRRSARRTRNDSPRSPPRPRLRPLRGIDARVRDHLVDEALSIGDFVLTGGEIAALAVLDAVARLVPGVLGNPDSPLHESFRHGLLEAPQYTRPATYRGWSVPEVLQSGHHEKVAEWRAEQSLARTRAIRPDLLPEE